MSGLMTAGGVGSKIVIANAAFYGRGTANVASFAWELTYLENGKLVEIKIVKLFDKPSFDFHGVRVQYGTSSGIANFTAISKCKFVQRNGVESSTEIEAGGSIMSTLYTAYASFIISF